MPGLLQTPSGQFGEAKFVYALIAEFIGVMLFAFAGSTTPQGNVSTQQGSMTVVTQQASGSANWAPWSVLASLLSCASTLENNEMLTLSNGSCRGNGMSLAVLSKYSLWLFSAAMRYIHSLLSSETLSADMYVSCSLHYSQHFRRSS